MTLDEAFEIINNLDLDEGLKRKFGPKYSLIVINRNGEIVTVERFRDHPTEQEQYATLNQHPRCIAIDASPGMYDSVSALRERIESDLWLFAKMKHDA